MWCFHNIGKYFGDRSDVSMLIIGCCHRPGGRWAGSSEGSVTTVDSDSDSAIVYSINRNFTKNYINLYKKYIYFIYHYTVYLMF